MLRRYINDFRASKGVGHFHGFYPVENWDCSMHCQHMARNKSLEHAPWYFIQGKGEAVGYAHISNGDIEGAMWRVFFDPQAGFCTSQEHSEIICRQHLAFECWRQDEVLWVTIRGW